MIKLILRETLAGLTALALAALAFGSLLAAFIAVRYGNAAHFDIAAYAATVSVIGVYFLTIGAALVHRFRILTR
jgi:hypothetical protein